MEYINEKNTAIVTVTFKDENGDPVTPTQAWYKLDCLTTGVVIRAETEILNPTSSLEITITAEENKIQDVKNMQEEKLLTVRFTYSGGTKQGVAEYKYIVISLKELAEIGLAGLINYSDLQDWIEPSPLDSDYRKLEIITEGVVADAEDYIDGKIKEVTDEVAYLDGGRSYLIIPHLNVTKISVWEDTSRVFPDSTMIDPTKYQVYTERGILRIGRPKHKESGGIAWMDRYFSDYYWDDYYFDRFFEGRREFLRGRQVIKVKYDGGWNQDTLKENLRLAIITQVGYRYRRRKDPGLSTVTYPDGSVTKMADIKQFLPEVQAVLDKFKRISIA